MKTLKNIFELYFNTPSDINELFPTLKKYAEQCRHITEFGVRDVCSTYALLAGHPNKMVSYDIYTSSNIQEALDIAKEEGIDLKFIEKDVLKTKIEKTDLLFIDTLHTYNQLTQELNLHSDEVNKYILMHDTKTFGLVNATGLDNSKQGLMTAIIDFLQTNDEWRIKEVITICNGLTVLEKIKKL